MSIKITYQEEASNQKELLLQAQIIANAFSKALDQNECNVKILIGLSEEISSEKDKIEDLLELVQDPKKPLQPLLPEDIGTETPYLDDKEGEGILTPESLLKEDIKRKLRRECLDCDFKFPTLNINSNFNWSFDKLKASLDAYKNIFKKMLDPNFCHVAGAFNYACIPSIISLIMLLVSAYAAILALQKLGGISLSAFIQGIISGLLGQILASLSIKMDTSNTGILCIVEAIREIADDIVAQQDQISGMVPEQVLRELGYSPESEDEEDPQWTRQDFLETYASMSNSHKSIVDKYLTKIEEENREVQKAVSNSFRAVSDVVQDINTNINEQMGSLFGLLDYFQCESERSGTDFTSLAEWADKITTVINLLSAILAVVARKKIERLCKTKTSVEELTTALEEDFTENETTDDLFQVEVIEEFLGKVVETVENNGEVTPIIYDKGKETLLPKLSLVSCNLSDFIESHQLEKVIDTIVKEIEEDEWKDTVVEGTTRDPIKKKEGITLPDSNVIDKGSWELYPIKFEKPNYSKKPIEEVTKEELSEDFNSETGISSSIKNILDLIYNNPLDTKRNDEGTESYPFEDFVKKPNEKEEDFSYKEKLGDSVFLTNTQKKAFENKCRDITDVLNTLEIITKK